MAMQIGLVTLLWALGTMAQYGGDRWYGTSQMTVNNQPVLGDQRDRLEEVRTEYFPPKQANGYGSKAFQQDGRDWERFSMVDVRGPPPAASFKSSGESGPYGKKSHVSKKLLNAKGQERKKMSRATQYTQYDEVASKNAPHAYNGAPLLIGCNPNVAKHTISTGGSYGDSGTSYYPMEYVYHDASYVQYDPPYPLAYHGYEQNPSGYYPPPPPPPTDPKHTVSDDHHSNHLEGTEYATETYYYPPSDFYGSSQPAYYPGYDMYPTEYYPPPPPAAPQVHPAPKAGGSSYKTAGHEIVPGFAAPVQEKLMESPKAPVISAFRKPSAPASSNTTASAGPKASVNGTVVAQEPAASTANPMPVLTTTPKPNEDDDAFWSVEANAEGTTDTVEGSTER